MKEFWGKLKCALNESPVTCVQDERVLAATAVPKAESLLKNLVHLGNGRTTFI